MNHQIPQLKEFRPLLFVDMDGTLFRTDTLWEQCALILKKPHLLFLLVLHLFKGKIAFKRFCLLNAGIPQIETLPFNNQVIEFLQEQKKQGAAIILATASRDETAHEVVKQFSIFDDYIASNDNVNLKGIEKLRKISSYAKGSNYYYIGNDKADLPIWDITKTAIVVSNSQGFISILQQRYNNVIVLQDDKRINVVKELLSEMRLYQWIKNILIFIPLLLAHSFELKGLYQSLIAFIAFSLTASSVYVFNDLLDLRADRLHPRKCNRPLASGTISIPLGLLFSVTLFSIAILLCILFLPINVMGIIGGYFIITSAYSVLFKKIPIVDVLTLAGLYTIRLIVGGVSANVVLSPWLLGFSMFLFLSLAFVKRYAEVIANKGKDVILNGRGYSTNDSLLLLSSGISSAMLSIMILALYINSDAVVKLYSHPEYLWIVCPVFLFWLMRLWLSAHRGTMHDDPIIAMARDRFSYVGLLIVIVSVLIAALP